ncbi:30S ribosomal protein S17 [bacterium]|nr:30S ribosomal protein S17 [Parcubacteria group bacterium]MBF05141.1 30S ribosomal protein S17 [bacterium]|tara:strand:+ start:25672 stop:25956 length:285 start_codon:yes stop_codon:yes gene_type:complete
MEDTNIQKAGLPAQAGKTLRGTVVGVDMKDTAKVAVARYVKHPKYKKFIKQVKKFLVHDPENIASVGDKVVIRESRPISKRKNFVLESNESATK